MVCLKCDHKRPIASNPAEIAPQTFNDSLNNHQTQHWYEQETLSSSNSRGEYEDQTGPSSWNGAPGFDDFPVAGGKSELSRDKHKQGQWKMEMAADSRTVIHKSEDPRRHDSYIFKGRRKMEMAVETRAANPSRREDPSGHESYIFRGTNKIPASEDDDDDMSKWFDKGLGS